jgi:multicomponent Na+:H+ antiporter subunit D
VILVSSLLNAVYFFRIIEKVYMKSPGDHAAKEEPAVKFGSVEPALSMLVPTIVFAVLLIGLGLFNALIVTRLILPMLPPGM